jgi:NhaA family Na+:H+ antiporter
MPLFALANTAVPLNVEFGEVFSSTLSIGVIAGLLIGKPLGIIGFSLLAVKFKIGSLSADITKRHLIGAGFLGGIGFTMSIFISMLAFDNPEHQAFAKISILVGSVTSGLIGYIILNGCKTEDTSD